MLLFGNASEECKTRHKLRMEFRIFATRIAFSCSTNDGVEAHGSDILDCRTLALGSLALGSFALGSLAVGGSALAGAGAGGEIGIGFTFAPPGQRGTSPGKVFHDARASDPTTALQPEKLYLQNKSNDPTTALPPGQTFSNYRQ